MAQLVARFHGMEEVGGSNPPSSTLCDVAGHRRQPEPSVWGFGFCRFVGLIGTCGVEGEVAEDLAGCGCGGGDVEVVDDLERWFDRVP